MPRPEPSDVKQITCVGAGIIGGGWVAYFLAKGFDVVATDPGEHAQARLNRVIDTAWPVLQQLTLAPDASRDRLHFTTDLAAAVAEADFIQESAPDDEELKVELFARIGEAARPDIVIASSSSAFLPSSISRNCANPRRCIVGHPFAPSYIMPLVEVVGAAETDPAVMAWAVSFYNGIGKKALRLNKEIDAYVANRLQHAVLEEAAALVDAGICEYDDIDTAMAYGPGLRWSFAGPAMCYHLGGGKGGIAHMIDHFGFGGSDFARQKILEGVKRMAAGRDVDTLEEWRDRNLVMLLKNLRMVGDGL